MKRCKLSTQEPLSAQQRDYRRFLRSTQWELQRCRIILRAKGICEICRKSRLRQVHHLRYGTPVEATPDSDLIGICGRCHRNSHIAAPRPAVNAEIRLF